MSYENLKKLLFKFEPETAHNIGEFALSKLAKLPLVSEALTRKYVYSDEALGQTLWDVTFPNPVGIAAGFDKNATMIQGLSALGFGYLEIGTVTPRPQAGNEKPRLFRFVEEKSIQNAMGFNNDGMKQVSSRIDKLYPYALPLGLNIGKNKTTSQENALKDYKMLVANFANLCDYITINISSPNTPNLRDLQNETFVQTLFTELKQITKKPILLKIAPDMSIDDALLICKIATQSGSDGIILSNTTIDYSVLKGAKNFGGISGAVLRQKSFELFHAISQEFFGKTVLISVGGIDSKEEAYKRIVYGASLVQIYTSFIFEGPKLVHDINAYIHSQLQKDGFVSIKEAVGSQL